MAQKKDTTIATRQDFLELEEPQVHKVWIETMQKYVYMKELSASDQDSYDYSMTKFIDDLETGKTTVERDMTDLKAKYLVRSLCDPKGNRIFRDEEAGRIGIKKKSIIKELHEKALEVNGASEKAVEETRKNSETETEGDSNSD